MNSFKSGDKVLVRVMECTSVEYDQWDVVYKTGVISQDNILSTDSKRLLTIKFSDDHSEHVWSNHILEYPKEWKN